MLCLTFGSSGNHVLSNDGFPLDMGPFPTLKGYISGTRRRLWAYYFLWDSQLLNKNSSVTLPDISVIKTSTLNILNTIGLSRAFPSHLLRGWTWLLKLRERAGRQQVADQAYFLRQGVLPSAARDGYALRVVLEFPSDVIHHHELSVHGINFKKTRISHQKKDMWWW